FRKINPAARTHATINRNPTTLPSFVGPTGSAIFSLPYGEQLNSPARCIATRMIEGLEGIATKTGPVAEHRFNRCHAELSGSDRENNLGKSPTWRHLRWRLAGRLTPLDISS